MIQSKRPPFSYFHFTISYALQIMAHPYGGAVSEHHYDEGDDSDVEASAGLMAMRFVEEDQACIEACLKNNGEQGEMLVSPPSPEHSERIFLR